MRRLIFLRHAKAIRPEPGMADLERSLEPRGRVEAARTARLLADLELAPDLVLLSPSRRTRETWKMMSDLLAAAVELDEQVYEASAETLIARAAVHADVDTLLVLGHNPGLKDAARLLMSDGPHDARALASLAQGLPTSCAIVLGIDELPAPHTARLAAFIAPARQDD